MMLRARLVPAFATLFLLAMSGATANDGALEIPEPERHFHATVTDSTQTQTNLKDFTWDGFVHVQGTLGAGTVAIPFDRIKRIDFEATNREKVVLSRLLLKTGEMVRLKVSGRLTCYGRTAFGNYRIQVKELSSIEFKSPQEASRKSKPE